LGLDNSFPNNLLFKNLL